MSLSEAGTRSSDGDFLRSSRRLGSGRGEEFDRRFLPRALHLKERWSRVAQAMNQGLQLPPIQVYKLGEQYVVCDGNHRVSVARHRGQGEIDATVIELRTKALVA